MMKWLIAALLVALSHPAAAFHRGVQSGVAPVLTASTVYGSMPGVSSSAMHQYGVTTTATIPSNQSLSSCNITGGDPSGFFSCVVSGGNATIQMTTSGAANYSGASDFQSQTLTVTGTNAGSQTSAGVSVTVNLYADGYAQARAASALLPTILSGYTAVNTAPWISPGVGYGVGVPTGTSLSDPSTLGSAAPYGCVVASHTCTISGSSNVTIGNCSGGTGIDFSLDNGWTLTGGVTGGATLTIQCSKFGIGTNNNNPITITTGNAVIINNTLDGAGNAGSAANHENLIESFTAGNITIEYNQFTNAYSDFIDFTYTLQGSSQAILVAWNLFSGYGATGTHADAVQTWGVNASSFKMAFNTAYEPAPSGGFPATSANSMIRIGDMQLHNSGTSDCGGSTDCVISNPVIAYNVAVLLGDGWGNIFQIDNRTSTGSIANNMPNLKIHDNYFDPTDSTGQAVYFTGMWTNLANGPNPQVWNAINLLTGVSVISSNNNAYPPGTPPSAGPAATSLTNSADAITLNGTAPSGETITIYDGNTSLGTSTSSGGAFSFTSGTLSSGVHTITASDIYANSTGPQLITLP